MNYYFMHWLEREAGVCGDEWKPQMFIVNTHPIERIVEMNRDSAREHVLVFFKRVPEALAMKHYDVLF